MRLSNDTLPELASRKARTLNMTSPRSSDLVTSRSDTPTAAELRRVVISYLCHHCYVDTARAFAQDSRPISIDASNGLESGFGHREADRDLTGAPLHRDETSRTANPEIVTVPIQEDIIPHLETVLPPLKDSDGDEVMAPPVTDELDQRVGTPQHIDEGHDARMSLDVERSSTQQDDIEVDAELADNIGMERERGDHVGMEADVQVESTTIPPPANLLAGEDGEDILREVGLRKDIRDHILWGRIQQAIDVLNAHFPNVLNEQLTVADASPPTGSTSLPITAHSSPTPPDTGASSKLIFSRSLMPSHLALNLRIQSFLEAVRTRPLSPPRLPPTSYLSSRDRSLERQLGYSPFSPPSPPSSRPSDQETILRLGRKLYQIAHALPSPGDRAIYLTELDPIWALMAYREPEKSPSHVSQYLSFERRIALANQINSAILLRTGNEPSPTLELYVRHTGAVWDTINEREIRIPNDVNKWPVGVVPPPSRPPTLKFPSSRETNIGPPFDFSRFLHASPPSDR